MTQLQEIRFVFRGVHPPSKSNGPSRFVEAWELDLGELVRPLGSQALCSLYLYDSQWHHVGLSENVGYIPNEIAIFHRDNDQQNHWV